jgi:hypothetical protein
MSPRGLSPVLLMLVALTGAVAGAQSLRLRTEAPKSSAEDQPAWPAFVRYSLATDFADDRSPRAYTHALFTSVGYQFDKNWSVNTELGMRAELVNGQISKGEEQTYAETVSPSTAVELDYEHEFMERHSYTLDLHGEPLWDEASRLEGYKGLVGGGAELTLKFFDKIYTMTHSIDVTELINTFQYGTNLQYNPDYFATYKLGNSIRFLKTWKVSYTFGLKATRYLDGFWGYNYQNTVSLAKTWKHLSVALAYDNGGFTDDGEVSMWYLDQYRRVGRLLINYAF